MRQTSKLSFQVVVDSFLDGLDGELQGAIPHLAGLGTQLGGFHVDKTLFFQLANVLGNRVSAHPHVLAYASNAGPALVGLPVLTEHQVCVDGQLTGGKSQSENLIGQKKIVTQRAAAGVSVLEFRGVPFPMAFKDSTPMFWPMSIAFSDFTLRSQVYSCKGSSDLFCRSPTLCLLHRKF